LWLASLVSSASHIIALRIDQPRCVLDDVVFAKIAANSCMLNKDADNKTLREEDQTVGGPACWKLLAYNTDEYLTSTLYRNQQSGQCIIGISGYHDIFVGAFAMTFPPGTRKFCGSRVFAPYVRVVKHHTNLSNWSTIVNLVAGPEAACSGEVALAGESLGGAVGEVIAHCSTAGSLHEVHGPGLPDFAVQTLYTFGAPATAERPLNNSLHEDGCFKGKRIFFSTDPIATWHRFAGLQHAKMDSVEVYPAKKQAPSVANYACNSKFASRDGRDGKRPPPLPTNETVETEGIPHAITEYQEILDFTHKHGWKGIFGAVRHRTSTAGNYLRVLAMRREK